MKMFFIISLSLFCTHSSWANLIETKSFGKNDGNLKMFTYTPKNVRANAPLIVLLHGCSQGASDYDDEIGFIHIAEKAGAVLLLPQQSNSNNSISCFNWFQPWDIDKGHGEGASIIEMVKHLQEKRIASRSKVFISGLSAGGAMAVSMIATYPKVFAGAAIVSGIPHGCARDVFNGLACMKSKTRTGAMWASYVYLSAGKYNGKFPKVMIFHGTNDPYVLNKNSHELKKQWTTIHQSNEESLIKENDLFVHKAYRNKLGRSMVETVSLKGMGHGQPIDTKSGCGEPQKYIVDHGVCAADMMAKFFRLKR